MPNKVPSEDPRWSKIRELIDRRNDLNNRIQSMYEEIRGIDVEVAAMRRDLLGAEAQPVQSNQSPASVPNASNPAGERV